MKKGDPGSSRQSLTLPLSLLGPLEPPGHSREISLEGVAVYPDQPIANLPPLTPAERHQVLVAWNGTRADYPKDKCIHELFEVQAERTADAVAVVYEEQRLTYEELNRRANQLAHYLRNQGVGPETLVGICLERSPEMVIGLMGILKAGGAYLPFDPQYPKERTAFMLEDSKAQVLLTHSSLSSSFTLRPSALKIVFLDTDWETIAAHPSHNPKVEMQPGSLAYVIYTSGSTGKPKGVLVGNENVLALLYAFEQVAPKRAEAIGTSVCPFSFDVSVWEIFSILCFGGTLHLIPQEILIDPKRFSRYLFTAAITSAYLPPMLLPELINEFESIKSDTLLDRILVGVEPIPQDLLNRFQNLSEPLRIVNGYGPTETTVCATFYHFHASVDPERRTPIGRAAAGYRVYLLDPYLQPVPIGVAGELHIGGAGLARGYLQQPELTAEKFIPDPFSSEPDARLYKSGDLARYLADGNIEFLGRMDHQVKIRGFRIELGEIEALLSRYPGVKEGVVLAREDVPGGKRLVAYLVPVDKDTLPDMIGLRSYLKSRLPEYMIPSAFVLMEFLPLTPIGKLDRKALPAPECQTPIDRYVAPRNSTEQTLAEIFSEVLGLERVSVYDSFFDLGGHSLLATQVISRIRQALGVELTMRQMFMNPMITALAEQIVNQIPVKASYPFITPLADKDHRLLSYGQERLWFLDQFEPDNPAYNISFRMRLHGPFHTAIFKKAVQEIVNRHEALRTTFVLSGNKPVQAIAKTLVQPIPVIDLSALPRSEQETRVEQLTSADNRQTFHLARGPLLRLTLLRLGVEEHVMLLSLQHIISDGGSVNLFLEELAVLYRAFLEGRSSPLAPLAVQYKDFAVWQRSWLDSGVLAVQLAYWQKQLHKELPVLEFPTDYPRPAVKTYNADILIMDLAEPLNQALRDLSRTQGCTLFMTLLAAFKTLMFRYSGQTDIAVGTPIDNRHFKEVEKLIGMFLNNLVLRTDLSGEPDFGEVLRKVRQTTMEAYENQDAPFEKVLQAIQPERDLSRTSLFQVFFNMFSLPHQEPDSPGLCFTDMQTSDRSCLFDFTLYVIEQSRQIRLRLVYNTDLFKRERMLEMLEQFRTLLQQVSEDPRKKISCYSLVTMNAKAVLPDPTRTLNADWAGAVHTLFAQQARRNPRQIAVQDKEEIWTYEELDRRSNQLANYLRTEGIGAGDRVAIYAHRSASLVWAILSVLKSGAAFLMLDPSYPEARLLGYLRMAAPKGCLQIAAAGALSQELVAYFEEIAGLRLMLPTHSQAVQDMFLAEYAEVEPAVAIGPDDPALLAFTSGSTGTPKGIVGRHGPLSHFLAWQQETFQLRQSDRYSLLSGLAHDPLQRDIFTSLCLGATLCIPDPDKIAEPGWLGNWMREEAVSITHLTPAMLNLLTQTVDQENQKKIVSLRYAFTVGDILTKQDVARLRQIAPRVKNINFYGTTETQRAVSYYPVPEELDQVPKAVIPLGRGMPDVQLLILTASQELAGIGELGEICVRSPHLARGYLNDEDLSNRKFILNPFTRKAGDRLYRTGDAGRYLPDGNAVFAERMDQQVQIRGFRIEPGEIEVALSRHPGVKEAVVTAWEDEQRNKRLAAYLVLKPGKKIDPKDLRSYLKEKLPEYMVPSDYTVLENLPLTPNGKVDRKALPRFEKRTSGPEKRPAAPRTPLEEELVRIWGNVLGMASIGIHSNFFELGGHSLLATQVISRLRQVFQVEVPLRALFEEPTIGGLARRVEAELKTEEGLPVRPIEPVSRDRSLPLSFAQQRLWFLDQFEPGSGTYNIPSALRIKGRPDLKALEQSLMEIARRHEALRTTFRMHNDLGEQVIAPEWQGKLTTVDLCAGERNRREEEVKRLVEEEAQRPFELGQGPLLRANLLKLDEEDHVLILVIHHIVSDGWSMGILWKELWTLYEAYQKGEPSPLPELSIQYADFSVWQRDRLQGQELERQLRYWKTNLQGAPAALELPLDHPRPPVQSYRGFAERFALSRELMEGLEQLSQKQGVTLFMTLLAAFKVLLYRYTSQTDILVGTPIANRNRIEIENLIGFFVNTLVLRTDVGGGPTFKGLLSRVKERALGAYGHQDLPFEKLVEELQPERDLSRSPLFQVMFTLQNVPDMHLESADGLESQWIDFTNGASMFDLTLSLLHSTAGIIGGVEYCTDLFEPETIRRMIGHFKTLLEGITVDPDRIIAELPFLTRAEEHQLLIEWNNTYREYPKDQCIHALFAEQAAKTADALSVVFGDQCLCYTELNRGANQLAHYLQKQGVGPESLVGICLERPFETVIALLGVLKAGGAYLPLDPNYPQERIAFMLEDSRTQILLTQSSLASRFTSNASAITIVCLDTEWQTIGGQSKNDPKVDVQSENPAYVIYTSGSTGKPKGVLIRHRSLANHHRAVIRHYGLSAGDRVLQFASINFDVAAEEIFPSWLSGAALILKPDTVLTSLPDFMRFAHIEALSVLNLPAAYWHELVSFMERSRERLPTGLRLMLVGSEPVLTKQLTVWQGLASDQVRWCNAYGITETTITTLMHEPDLGRGLPSLPFVPIGRPLDNTRIYLLDEHLQAVPVGIPAELYIGGDCLARGYLNNPRLTAERFIPNPFIERSSISEIPHPCERLYRTGDLARWLPDGNIQYLGRIDFQAKIRGFRIELGEIEAVLRRHDEVQDAVVTVREDVPDQKQLAAYVAGKEGSKPIAAELRNYLKKQLPEYMVPSFFVVLDSWPLTPNGKVDRKALPIPGKKRGESGKEYVAPRTTTEEIMVEIFRDVLGSEQVGVFDNFFELGGHSLMAITLLERMRRKGVYVDLRALFGMPTIAELAAVAGSWSHEIEVPANRIPAECPGIVPAMLPLVDLSQAEIDRIIEKVPGGAANVQDIYPLAPLQEGILFHHLMTTEGDIYLLFSLYRFDNRQRLEDFLNALQKVIDRHDILRTAVVWEGLTEPVQVVWRRAALVVEEIALDPKGGDAGEQLCRRFDPNHTRIDLGQAPLIRIYMAQDITRDCWLLLILNHHLTGDHTTLEVMQEEVQVHLLGKAERLPEPLPFRNFVAQARLGVNREEHRMFFEQMLGDVDEPTAPFGLLDVQGDGSRIKEAYLEVDASLAERLREQARGLKVSAASLCHLAWAQVLARVSAREDVVFGTVLFGRMQGGEGIDRVMGMFMNTLPVRIRIGKEGVAAGVGRMHALLTDLLRHEHASLALAQRCSGVPAPTPLFSALLNYRHNESTAQAFSAEAMQAWEGIEHLYSEERTNYPFVLSVNDQGRGFSLAAQVASAVEPMRVCRFMHTTLEQLAEALERAPLTPLCNLDVLPDAERKQLIEEFNRTQAEYPRHKTIQQLFEEQVIRTPDALSVVFEDQCLCYAELNRRANRLAHYLRLQGIGPEGLVGICLERSLEMVIALLGVLKASGAYLPLDPGYPQERIAFMLEDSKTQILLTQSSLSSRFMSNDSPFTVICLNTEWQSIAEQDMDNPKVVIRSENLAYVIYTSGSTGKPKGVQIPHRAVINLLNSMLNALEWSSEERLLSVTSLSFDIAGLELYLPLISGAGLELLNRQKAADGEQLYRCLAQGCMTVMQATPVTWRLLLAAGWPGDKGFKILCGGEAMPPDLAASLSEREVKTWNLYGPTETTIWSTSSRLMQGETLSIGRPIHNTQMYVLNSLQQAVPVGVPGELYIGGEGLARGYLNRPDLTAGKFIPDSYSNEPGARLCKTGDLARYFTDGNIDFLGRIDTQVKIRGYRIELGEIEAVLRQHPHVNEVVVMVRDRMQDLGHTGSEGQPGPADPRLVAYLVLKQIPGPPDDELLDFLKSKLPAYMMPSAFVTLETLPLLPNGKINRKALPIPDPHRLQAMMPAPLARSADIADWFYTPVWKQIEPLSCNSLETIGRWLVFGDHKRLSKILARQLRKNGREVILIREGKRFAAHRNGYSIRPGFSEDYRNLISELQKQDRMPGAIIHLWNLPALHRKALANPEKALTYSFYSPLFLAQALGREKHSQTLSLTLVSSYMQKVGAEEMIQPAKAALQGLCRIIPQELPQISCRSMDVVIPKARSPEESQLVELIIRESESRAADAIISYRGNKRLMRTYERRPLDHNKSMLREKGVYLITDGPECLGLDLAQYLARSMHARIVLITDAPLPEPEMRQEYLKTHAPQDPSYLLIQAVEEWESLNLPGLTLRAEVSNPEQMKAAVRAACRSFGTIHGVIHAAGSGVGQRILLENPQAATKIWTPQIQGIRVLRKVLEEIKLDFMAVCFPLTSLVGGGLGRGAPSAAAAFAQAEATNGNPACMTLYWDKEIRIREQADEAYERLFFHESAGRTLIVSPCALEGVMERSAQITRMQAREADANLLTHDLALADGMEEKLALIWKELLGVGRITRNDSFFSVGGHSLVAIRLINRVRDTFKVDIPIRTTFEAPTIAELAKRIEQAHKEE